MDKYGNSKSGYCGTNSNGFQIGTGTLWTGTSVPDNADGANGDFYFRTDGQIYKKLSDAWSVFSGAASHTFEESTLVAKTANYTLLTADKGKTTVFNGSSLTCTAPTATAALDGKIFNIQNINASALTVSGVQGLTSLAENESAILIVDNTNSEVRLLASTTGGDLELISEETLTSAQTTVTFTDIPTGYNYYELYIRYTSAVNNRPVPMIQYSTNNGSTYITTANYFYDLFGTSTSTSTIGIGARLIAGALDNVGNVFCKARLKGLKQTGVTDVHVDSEVHQTTFRSGTGGGGNVATSVDAFRLVDMNSSDTYPIGATFSLYGVK